MPSNYINLSATPIAEEKLENSSFVVSNDEESPSVCYILCKQKPLPTTDPAKKSQCEAVEPLDDLKDLICFAFTNLSSCNLLDTVTEFSDSVVYTQLPLVAEYLVE